MDYSIRSRTHLWTTRVSSLPLSARVTFYHQSTLLSGSRPVVDPFVNKVNPIHDTSDSYLSQLTFTLSLLPSSLSPTYHNPTLIPVHKSTRHILSFLLTTTIFVVTVSSTPKNTLSSPPYQIPVVNNRAYVHGETVLHPPLCLGWRCSTLPTSRPPQESALSPQSILCLHLHPLWVTSPMCMSPQQPVP